MSYINFSMSVNAANAYSDNIKPKSRFSKNDFIEAVEDETKKKIIRSAPVALLRSELLNYSEWHHTSIFYNQTDFYKIRDDLEEMSTDELMQILEPKPKQEKQDRRAFCRFLVWSGTRKHPKAKKEESEGVIRGKWFYLPAGNRKNIDANGFHIVKYLD